MGIHTTRDTYWRHGGHSPAGGWGIRKYAEQRTLRGAGTNAQN